MSWKLKETGDSIESLCPLDVTELKGLKTDFELYLDVAGKPVLYAQGPYEWSINEIERLNHDGFSVLFYSKANDEKVVELLSQSSLNPISLLHGDEAHLAEQNRVAHLLKIYNDWISQVDIPEHQKQVIADATDAMVETISENPVLVEKLQALSNHDYYSFYHSMRTTAYSALISVELGCTSAQHLHEIILGCLVHDIGHLKVQKEILEKEQRLNEKEWFEIKQHPLHGIELLKSVPLGPIARDIILHHHEREDGHGYPYGIFGNDLKQEIKVVSFCDMFDALTSPRPYQKPISFEEALKFIEDNALEFLDQKSFEAMKNLVTGRNLKAPV